MRPLDQLRLLPLELEPPRGVRERTRQRLLASVSASLAPSPSSDVAPRPASLLPPPVRDVAPHPASTAAMAQQAGAKMVLVAFGSLLVGATLAVSVPSLSSRLRDATKQNASAYAPLTSPPARSAPSTPLAVPATAPDVPSTALAAGAPLVAGAPLTAATTAIATSGPKFAGHATPSREDAAASRGHRSSSVDFVEQSSPSSQQKPTQGTSAAAASLAAERKLLDAAREQLSKGQARHAVDLTELHLRRFARGRLAEEREALAIVALARAGELARSHQRAERFKQRYPNSFLRKVVEGSLGESQ